MSEPAAPIETRIDCLIPTSRVNRRFRAPGKQHNTAPRHGISRRGYFTPE